MWLPVREAARRLEVPEESILGLVREGKVRFSMAGNRLTKVRPREVARAMEQDAQERLVGKLPHMTPVRINLVGSSRGYLVGGTRSARGRAFR